MASIENISDPAMMEGLAEEASELAQAAESFDDMGMAIRLLIEEITQKVEESVREMREEQNVVI